MQTTTYFRIAEPNALAAVLAAFDRAASRRFGDLFAKAVADEVAALVDLHRSGVAPKDPGGCPLKDAVDLTRSRLASGELDLGCRMSVTVGEGQVDLALRSPGDGYATILGSIEGVEESDGDQRQPHQAGHPSLGYRLPHGPVPAPKWTSVRLRIPDIGMRLERTARAVALRSPIRAEAALERARRWLPDPMDKLDLRAYGSSPAAAVQEARERPRPAAGAAAPPALVDHCDVVATVDGHIFVAVMDAGFSERDRLVLNLNGRDLTFAQGGRDFGTIPDVPHSSVALLRPRSFVSVVEMLRLTGGNEVKSHHMAHVREIGEGLDIEGALDRWRSRIPTTDRKAEAEWARSRRNP